MTERAAGILAVCLLGLGLQVQAFGGDGTCVRAVSAQRLVYVFSPDQEMHRQRARQLPDWVAGTRDGIHLTGVVRWTEGTGSGAGKALDPREVDLDLQRELGFPVARSAESVAAGLPAGLLADIPSGMDYALLLTGVGAVVWAIPGDQLQLRLAQAALATDIDPSTWGKIKEMFQ